MNKTLLLLCALSVVTGVNAQRADNYLPTKNAAVELTQTNLPIVFINVNHKEIQREDRITARMKIIDNGAGKLNYGDTIAHPDQKVDYEGYIGLKYRGNSSFTSSDKKPYGFKPLDKTIEDGGKKVKVKIMGMGKDNDWALLAPFADKTMIRDVLTFELARNYFDYVPHSKFCEVVLDGTYYGVYIMTERVGKGKNRLNLNDPGSDDGDLTGDYHVEIDRDDEPNFYRSKYSPLNGSGAEMTDKYITYQYDDPEYEDFADLPGGALESLHKLIDEMEASFRTENYKDPVNGYRKYIDVQSFIDYMLATEMSFDIDGYRLSTNLYKYSEARAQKEGLDSRWKMSLWDKNIAYGNANYYQGDRTDLWQYNYNARNGDDAQLVPFWWSKMLADEAYVEQMKERWAQYRRESYSDERLMATVDSLTNVLTAEGAIDRNEAAWGMFGRNVWPNAFAGNNYDEDVTYLKTWIRRRLKFMDKQLIGGNVNLHTVPVTVSSGWNADLIVEAIPCSTHCTDGVDGGMTFYSEAASAEGGLPTSREITSGNDINYKLAPYNRQNALVMNSLEQGTVTFSEPFSTSSLYILATSANGSSDITVKFNYSDGTSSDEQLMGIPDWSVNNPTGDEAVSGLGRVGRNDNRFTSGTACHFCLFEEEFDADASKMIQSVTLKCTRGGRVSVYAFSKKDDSATAINSVAADNGAKGKIVGIYDISGRSLNALVKGVNIVKFENGEVVKVIRR